MEVIKLLVDFTKRYILNKCIVIYTILISVIKLRCICRLLVIKSEVIINTKSTFACILYVYHNITMKKITSFSVE